MRELLRKHRILIAIIFVFFIVAIIIVPLVINLLYKIKSDSIFSTEWDAGDALSFYGGVLTLIGSVLVSAIALIQTYRLNKMTEQRYYENTKRPYFNINEIFGTRDNGNGQWSFYYSGNSYCYSYKEQKKNIKLFVTLQNCGDGDAIEFTYNGAYLGDDRGAKFATILKDSKYTVEKTISLSKNKVIIPISYKNILGCKYTQDIRIDTSREINEEDAEEMETKVKVYPLSIQKII